VHNGTIHYFTVVYDGKIPKCSVYRRQKGGDPRQAQVKPGSGILVVIIINTNASKKGLWGEK